MYDISLERYTENGHSDSFRDGNCVAGKMRLTFLINILLAPLEFCTI